MAWAGGGVRGVLRAAWPLSIVALVMVPLPAARAAACVVSAGVTEVGSTVTGTAGPDTIDCSAAGEGRTIVGLGGNDQITGSDHVDVIVPGDGDDHVNGRGPSGDVLDFRDAPARAVASITGATNDGFGIVEAGQYAGIESLHGSDWNDKLTGGSSQNTLEGAAGNDVLAGGTGTDRLDGGAGRDRATYVGAPHAVTVDLREGTAIGDGPDVLVSIENVTGSPYGDTLLGSPADNAMSGGDGPDLLRGGDGEDTLAGNDGTDSLVGGTHDDALDGGLKLDGCSEDTGAGTKKSCERLAFGEAMRVTLFQPTDNVHGVGFHESLFDVAPAMRPHGRLTLNDNPGKFTPPAEQTDGLNYVVMGSRGRPTPATATTDLVVDSSTIVRSPVNGTVVDVFPYLLYCESPDWEVVIRPYGRPDVLLIFLHMLDISVSPGDRVIASVTAVGSSHVNDTADAQENEYFPDQYPHVHVEIANDDEAPVPGCRRPPGPPAPGAPIPSE